MLKRFRQKNKELRKVSLRTAVALTITALIIQYFVLESSALASTQNYIARYSPVTAAYNYEHVKYAADQYTIELEVPEGTNLQLSPDQGDEMQFNVYFTNSKLAFRGYIQLWKIKDLAFFLNNSKNLSPFDFKSYEMSNMKENYDQGFKTEWSADFGDKVISGKEFWWKVSKAEEVVRLSFYSDSEEFPESLHFTIQHMIDSLKVTPKQ